MSFTAIWVSILLIVLAIETYTAIKKPSETITATVKKYIPKWAILVLMTAGMLHFLGVV